MNVSEVEDHISVKYEVKRRLGKGVSCMSHILKTWESETGFLPEVVQHIAKATGKPDVLFIYLAKGCTKLLILLNCSRYISCCLKCSEFNRQYVYATTATEMVTQK